MSDHAAPGAPANGARRTVENEATQAVERAASHVWIRSAVLSAILFLLVMYTLYFAASLLIPITLAFLLSVVLSPLVRVLGRLLVPQPVAALMVMLGFATLLIVLAYAIVQPAIGWMNRAPDELQQLEYKLAWVKEPIEDLQEARRQVDRIANVANGDGADEPADPPPPPRGQPAFSLVDSVLLATPTFAYGVAVTLILLFFILASGDALLNKAVQVTPRFTDKRRVVETGRGIQENVSRYLGTITIINAGVGVAVGLSMYVLDVPNPALWGVMAAVLNYIPYIGVLISIAVVTLVGLMTFEDMLSVVLPPLAIFGINVVEGQFLTPILAGRRLALSPVAIFLSLVVMGWIWGIFGALMAVPILAIVKLVCEEIEQLNGIATFLGSD